MNKRARRAREVVVVKDEEARPLAPPLRRGLALIILFVSSSREYAREQKNKFEDDAKRGRGSQEGSGQKK